MEGVDQHIDLTRLPFPESSFDVLCASHVLEHIEDDRLALSEVRRVLRPGGFALLAVPLCSPTTVEYSEPNPHDDSHWRAPGPDYFDRYKDYFSHVDVRRSSDYDQKYQTCLFERRNHFPTPELPLRKPMPGDVHEDMVPVCYV